MAARNTKQMKKGELGGFTIIEVVLVLAIAGLIFLMVFIALPQLQRSQRDTQRRNNLAEVSTALTQYQTNNNGKLPTTGGSRLNPQKDNLNLPNCGTNTVAACFVRNYMNGINATENSFIDPDGWAYGLQIANVMNGQEINLSTFDHIVYIYEHAKCDGEKTVYSENSRDYTVMYKLEGAGTFCQDNQG